jgi:hypothetical protein
MNTDVRNAQMFLDDEVIEQAVRLKRVVHQPRKYFANPVYSVEEPWEGNGVIYLAGVYVDPVDGLWKAWYVTLAPPAYPEIRFAICMIVSDDGIHWRRPEFDVYRGHNGEWTNIVLDLGPAGRTAGPTIIHEPDQEEPWTMYMSLAWPEESMHYRGYFLKSVDGIHWRWVNERPNGLEHGMHDRTTATTGPDPEFPYVIIGRGKEDIYRWDLPRTAHRVATNFDYPEDGEPTRVIVPDLVDDPTGQIYHAHAFPYEGIWVGLFQWYWETEDPWGEMELITSRDTVNWDRIEPRTSFLPPSQDQSAFDSRITDTALSPPIRTVGGAMPMSWGGMNGLWFYYWGGPAMHGNRHLTFGRSLGMAQLRADGFCSLRTGPYPGFLTTKAFTWPGGRLSINALILGGSGNGRIRVEVLGSDLQPIDGLTRDDADEFKTDTTNHICTWNGDPRGISKLEGQEIYVRFCLDHAEIYSFRAVADEG